jgi:hypothetical protein
MAQLVPLALALLSLSPISGEVAQELGQEASSASAEEAPELPYLSQVWELLLPPRRNKPVSIDERAIRLAKLGPAAIPALCAVYCGKVTEPSIVADVDPEAVDRRPELVLAALTKMPPPQVLEHVRSLQLDPSYGVDEVLCLAKIAAHVPSEAACEVVLGLLLAIEDIQLSREYVRTSLAESLSTVLQRGSKSLQVLERVIEQQVKPAAVVPLARAIGATHSQRYLPLLAVLLGRHLESDALVLDELARLGRWIPRDASFPTIRPIREALESHRSPEARASAALALASLGDIASVPEIIDLLATDDPQLGRVALEALRDLSREKLERDGDAWRRWLAKESSWWVGTAPELLGSLAGLEPAELVVALGELTRHPLYRHEVAVEVAALLERSESEVKNLVFSALWRLRSPRAVPLLLEQLHSEDEDLRSRVHELLGALTGLRLPAQASSWKLALAL